MKRRILDHLSAVNFDGRCEPDVRIRTNHLENMPKKAGVGRRLLEGNQELEACVHGLSSPDTRESTQVDEADSNHFETNSQTSESRGTRLLIESRENKIIGQRGKMVMPPAQTNRVLFSLCMIITNHDS